MVSIQAFLDDYGKITVAVSRRFYGGKSGGFYISGENDEKLRECTVIGHFENDREHRYNLSYAGELEFGQDYYLVEEHGLTVPLQVRGIVRAERFDNEFAYDGDDLGSNYTPEYTDFAVWTPTASDVLLKLTNGKEKSVVPMERTEKGVYRCRVEGDLSHAVYVYMICHNGKYVDSPDPYAVSSLANNRASAVIDTAQIMKIKDPGVAYELKSMCDAIIYECNVRDMTSSLKTGTSTNGKYSSLCETGTTYEGEPTGLDYIASLGITHVQLQPVIDYATVDEMHAKKNYNWGYDPSQIFALEGSYSLHPNDPYSRVLEFRQLVATLHSRNIRVVLDVVWNHMYETVNNALGKTVPYYFYRADEYGNISNGSFCGNDIESRRKMVRHLLKKAVTTLVTLYGIDGLRFDLMGILDVDTMNMLADTLRGLKKDAIIYGEGWDMPTALPGELKSTIYNQEKIPHIGHFNDYFRDVLKGKTGDGDKYDRGYLTGNREHCHGACSALTANAIGQPYFRRFSSPEQSINALETHDNATVWDKMHFCCADEPRDVRLNRMKMMIACTLMAQGIPFIHAGMEFAGTKLDNSNSYNAGDQTNQMDWDRRMMNRHLVEYTKKCISLRHSVSLFRLSSAKEIEKRVHFYYEMNGTLYYDVDGRDIGLGRVRMILNPNRENNTYYFTEDWRVLLDPSGNMHEDLCRSVTVPMCSVVVLHSFN